MDIYLSSYASSIIYYEQINTWSEMLLGLKLSMKRGPKRWIRWRWADGRCCCCCSHCCCRWRGCWRMQQFPRRRWRKNEMENERKGGKIKEEKGLKGRNRREREREKGRWCCLSFSKLAATFFLSSTAKLQHSQLSSHTITTTAIWQ